MIFALLFPLALSASSGIDVNEQSMFSDTTQITDSTSMVQNAVARESGEDKKSLGFSGNVLSVMQSGVTRSYMQKPDVRQSSFGGSVVGDMNLDARLQRGFKAFADLEWSYNTNAAATSQSGGLDSGTSWRMPELFVDANINHKVYFRAGKQVLQWGRCYFFNPTDLVNIDHKTFFQRIGSREGVYGAKIHVPFGTTWNLYGFLDAHDAQRPDSLAAAAKIEWLLGGTEMSAMIWDKGHRDPVYGADVSTRILGLDINGEAALYQTFESKTLAFQGGMPRIETNQKDWEPRVALGLGKSFNVSGIQDRLNTVAEFYYNRPGVAGKHMGLADLIAVAPAGGASTNALAALMSSGFYEPNSYSQHYAAFFATFNRFIRSDITLTFNTIGNLDQQCAILSSGFMYQDINDFNLGFFVYGFAGPQDAEYTLSRQAIQIQLTAQVVF